MNAYSLRYKYNKTEHMVHGSPEMYQYTHLIIEAKSKYSSNMKPYLYTHEIMDIMESFHQVSFNYFTIPPIKIKTRPILFLLKRKEDYLEFMPNLPKFEDIKQNQNYENNVEVVNDISESKEKIHGNQIVLPDNDTSNAKHQVILEKLRQELHESYEASDYTAYKSNMSNHDSLKRINKNEIESEVEDISVDIEEPKFNNHTSKWDETADKENKNKPSTKYIKTNVNKAEKIHSKIIVDKIKRDDTKIMKTMEEKRKGPSKNIIRGKVKDNIKKIIKQFKEEQIRHTSEEKTAGTKEKIRNIIEKERKILQEEELNNLQKQIVTIIENSPNIINKETIKEKLNNVILQDRHNIAANMEKISDKYKLKKPPKTETLPQKHKLEIITAEENSCDSKIEQKMEPVVITSEKGFLESDVSSVSKESTEVENALDLYDEYNHNLAGISDDEDNDFEYDSENINAYSSLEMEFQAASAHLENIMVMIEEIVSNIDVEESYSEDIQ